jgi:hypothetical protein
MKVLKVLKVGQAFSIYASVQSCDVPRILAHGSEKHVDLGPRFSEALPIRGAKRANSPMSSPMMSGRSSASAG